MSWFDKLLGRSSSTMTLLYEEQKELAISGNDKQRLQLAQNNETNKEILFYLAEHDPSPKVRQAVAKNNSTPLHASNKLATDSSLDVRMALASRLVTLLPDLSTDTQSQLYAYAVQALGALALDEVLKIRKSLSSALKDHAYAPPSIAAQLARDIEREVAEPILLFCVTLRDDDLVDILADHPASWAAEAVAKRNSISARVSKAVIKTGHAKAGTLLLTNKGAEIDEEVLQTIIERAREFPEWHEPLATNHKLPADMATQMARYVDARIRKILEEKGGYDLETTEIVTDATRRRIEMEEEANASPAEKLRKVKRLYKDGGLTEDLIADHLAMRDKEFVVASLSCLAGTNVGTINKVFKIQKAAHVCAVCWKSGLSMRFAFRLQQEMAHIQVKELIYPRGGTEYPLEEKDMEWQLEFLGISVK